MQSRSPLLTLTLLAVVILLLFQLHREKHYRLELAGINAKMAAMQGTQPPSTSSGAVRAPAPPVSPATEIYRHVSPSVVAVANKALVRRGFFSMQIYEIPQGSGTGFVWDKLGHIVSNYHVVHQADTLTVTFPDGDQYDAQLIGVAPDYDLAVLRIDAPKEKLSPVEVSDSRQLSVGENVFAIGNPFGLDTTLSAGIVSALGRTITSMTERKIRDVIQTDAAINPGNSGGPLLDSAGRLVGVNTAILSPSGAYAGIGFAVPSATVSRVVPQLIEKGHVTRAGLGVELLPDHITERTGIRGVAIYAVEGNTPAAKAGLEGLSLNRRGAVVFGDIVTAVNGHPVSTVEEMRTMFDSCKPGDLAELTVVRNRQTRQVKFRLVEE